MIITKFYNLINAELDDILRDNPSDARLKQHKDIAQNKGYALLIWFLKFYGQKDLIGIDDTLTLSTDLNNTSDEVRR